MCLLAPFTVLVHNLISVFSLRCEKPQCHFKVVVAHTDSSACISRGKGQSFRPQAKGTVSCPAKEEKRVYYKLYQTHFQ